MQNEVEYTRANLLNLLKEFYLEDNIINNLLEYFTSHKSIDYNRYNDTYKLNDNIQYLNTMLVKANTDWIEFSNDAKNIIEKNNLVNINNLNFDESFFFYFYNVFDNNIINNNDETNLDISLIIEDIKKEHGSNNKYFDIIENIINGIAIIKSISYIQSENKNIVKIYLDNVFVCNILGWCDNIRHKNSLSIIHYLKNNGFVIKIHRETLELVYINVSKYISAKNNNRNIKVGTLYHYLQSPDPKNSYLNVNKLPLSNVKDNIIKKLKDNYIEIDTDYLDIKIDYLDPLYSNIDYKRQLMYRKKQQGIEFGEIEIWPSKEQTDYDYKIIKYYTEKNNKLISSDIVLDELFLTYQSAIFGSLSYNQNEYIYSYIMWIKQFIKISVLDNILHNITSNISLYKGLIFDYFNNILSNEVIEKLHDIINNQNISNDDRKMILGFAADSNHWKDIIINEPEEIINSIKEQDDKIEELKKINKELNCSMNELKEQNENHILEYNNKIIELSGQITEQNTKTDKLTLDVSKANKTAKKAELKTRKYLFIMKLTLFWVVAIVLFTVVFLLQNNILKIENTLLKYIFEYIWGIISFFLTIKEIIGYFKDKKSILKRYDDLSK
ncbi:hypothetical protein [Brachyspira murdochii]|uniref:Uncharacterized protein n=1 Tax=Brachyspira murdochii (strain ATCC 51284 / DSM 12563 / 56-150) TaxID=526224 RepID=D5UBA5_BRAM5|nr:hypothetical protein [Brachyspira murdochii]ADG71978.1 hypothetical protein Bmur_1898 [Brachyspira murdochii DSM 12563]